MIRRILKNTGLGLVALQFAGGFLFCQEQGVKFHPIEEKLPEARESIYSNRISKVLKKPTSSFFPEKGASDVPLQVIAIRTPEQPLYIGIQKQMVIEAPFAQVTTVIEKFDAYPDFMEGVKSVKVVKQEGNWITTLWERKAPVFFLPNVKYEQMYVIDRSNPDRAIYRYQLKSGDSIQFSDGIIIVEKNGNSTRVTAFDFFSANWGLLGGVASSRIWKESVRTSNLGDLLFKTHAEHPDWKYSQLKKHSEQILRRMSHESIQYKDRLEID
jgi:uncharacterized membrane protein